MTTLCVISLHMLISSHLTATTLPFEFDISKHIADTGDIYLRAISVNSLYTETKLTSVSQCKDKAKHLLKSKPEAFKQGMGEQSYWQSDVIAKWHYFSSLQGISKHGKLISRSNEINEHNKQ